MPIEALKCHRWINSIDPSKKKVWVFASRLTLFGYANPHLESFIKNQYPAFQIHTITVRYLFQASQNLQNILIKY